MTTTVTTPAVSPTPTRCSRGWAAHGFCVNCGVDRKLIDQAYADYGSFAMDALAPPPAAPKHSRHVR
jgi:hypothetical protein